MSTSSLNTPQRPPFKFEVKSYRKNIVIGCADDEQVAPQEVVFDVVACVTPKAELLVDTWHPAFDYCVLTHAIDEACALLKLKILQEPLAYDVISRIFESHPLIEAVDLMVCKTQRYSGTDYIGFRLSLNREQWEHLRTDVAQVQARIDGEAAAPGSQP